MRTQAPGKVVLSGAYSVLEGVPAIVTAVDRYVLADSGILGEFLTEEVKAAGFALPYWFDASALRHEQRKLGLGSSAAILVATLAAQSVERDCQLDVAALRDAVYPRALHAHRVAQGGGSGIDVAASCYGGFLQFQLTSDGGTRLQSRTSIASLYLEVWSSNVASSTAGMLTELRRYAVGDPANYQHDMAAQASAAQMTAAAWAEDDARNVVMGLMAQRHALQRLGHDAKIPIVTRELQMLADMAEQRGAAVLPAGAGGGDIALFVGTRSSVDMTDAIRELGHVRLPLLLGAEGVTATHENKPSGTS